MSSNESKSGDAKKPSAARRGNATRSRSYARRCAMQALYQWQLTQQTYSEILAQFIDRDEYKTVDADYFRELLSGAIEQHAAFAARVGEYADRPWEQMDPIERAVLLIGVYELLNRLDVPYRVVVNEAVELTKSFGATDGYKYINALLDRMARDLRGGERNQSR